MNNTINKLKNKQYRQGGPDKSGSPAYCRISEEYKYTEEWAKTEPPSSITGVETTLGKKIECLTDWVSYTYPIEIKVNQVLDTFENNEFVHIDRGAMGYRQSYKCGGTTIYYDGAENMGVHVVISGTGIREMEARGINIIPWCKTRFIEGCKFTRLDIAIDDRTETITVSKIVKELESGNVSGRYKVWTPIRSYRRTKNGNELINEGVSIGSRKSETYIRIYNKAKEQKQEEPWTRLEVEFKGDKANEAIIQMIASDEEINYIVRVVRGIIEVKEPSLDSNRSRRKVAGWWEEFLGYVEKLRITVKPSVRTIETVKQWIKKQVAPSLAMIAIASGGEIEEIIKIVNEGLPKIKTSKYALLMGSI